MAKALDAIPENIQREIQEAATSGGVEKLKSLMERKNNDWKTIPLNIAVTGASGVGKSTFINAIRGLTADDEGGAHVDVVEGTRVIKKYAHPSNSSMVLWDLPGVGTPNFQRSNYLKQVQFERYDFFLILSAGRFREDDLLLAQEIQKMKKNFHFVRTQMDLEVKNDKKAHPKTHKKSNVISKVKSDCQENLVKKGLYTASVFLIDNYSRWDFDFGELTKQLIDEAPVHKRNAMVLSMTVLTDGILEKKEKVLQERIPRTSLQASLCRAVPLPGVPSAVENVVLFREVKFYTSQLGLTDEAIKEYASILKTESEQLKRKLGLKGIETSEQRLKEAVFTYRDSSAAQSFLPFVLPIFGSILSVKHSYGQSEETLRYFLSILLEDARKLNKAVMTKMIFQ